ncbi:MAG: cadherin repeat domain-containing protein [Pseudomonadota bacterium]
MGCMSNKKGGFKKNAWGNWKKKWAKKKCDWNDRDDRKDGFEKKIIKFNCDDGFKFKKYGWTSEDACNWKSKKDWKSSKCDDGDKSCGTKKGWKKKDWKKKDHDKKYDWKKFADCDDETPEKPETDGPVDQADNRAPEIVAPTNPDVRIDNSAYNTVVATVEAVDLDGDTLFFKINDSNDQDSPDADQFVIDQQTGEITMVQAPSVFGSADGDWMYQIEVEVTDQLATDSIILDINYVAAA